jgi:hypothetical protein
VECFDSSEVFSALYRGMLLHLSHHDVFCPLLFEVLPFAVEPPSLARTWSIRVLAVFYRSTLTLLLRKKEEGWGTSYYPRRASSNGLQ